LLLASITLILLLGCTSADALNRYFSPNQSLPLESNVDDALRLINKQSEYNEDLENEKFKDKISMKDIFGDEQVFPFDPGLGNHGDAVNLIPGGHNIY